MDEREIDDQERQLRQELDDAMEEQARIAAWIELARDHPLLSDVDRATLNDQIGRLTDIVEIMRQRLWRAGGQPPSEQ